jgi:hypothetical protein
MESHLPEEWTPEEWLSDRINGSDRSILKSIEAIASQNENPREVWRGEITIGDLLAALLEEKKRRGL